MRTNLPAPPSPSAGAGALCRGCLMGSGARLLPPGSTVYTCMLNKQGGVESDLTVSRISPGDPASPLAPAFEGKRPEHGDAGGGGVSAAAVGLGADIAGWVYPPAVQLPASPAAFFSCVNAHKDLSSPRKPWRQVQSEACQHLLHPCRARGLQAQG